MADRARDPESLEREIERTREELARTIDALADRVSPKNVAARGIARIKEEADQLTSAVAAIVGPPDPEDHEAVKRRNTAIMIGSGVLLTVAVVGLWRSRRKRKRGG
jgi:Protein of unknown function (DUF3618)